VLPVYLKSIKKLCEYGFKITEENIEDILSINEDSFEKMKEVLLKEVTEKIWEDLNEEYKEIIKYIDIEKFIQNRKEKYNIIIGSKAYKEIIDLLKNKREEFYD